ncbi:MULTISPECIES: hypothetical protein [Streptomyces]|uniref:hypothetical protein n=1 Tax=Streptomyces TaxID=1883 RepID=UPI00068FD85F|nr:MULTISPECIES: hypothetical protein [Streptomyces]
MDRQEAQKALAAAETAASRLHEGARWHAAGVFLLGIAMMVLTATYGLLVQPSVPYAIPVGLLIPLLLLGVYTATRPVVPRHHRALYAVITSAGAGIYTLTVLLGTVEFSGEPLWWLPGAVLCAVPFFLVALLDRRAGHSGTRKP